MPLGDEAAATKRKNRRIINEKEEKAGKRHLHVQSIVDWARLGRQTTGTLYLSRKVNKVTGGSAS